MTRMHIDGYFQRILGIVLSVFDAYTAALFLSDEPEGAAERDCRMAAVFSLGDAVDKGARLGPGQGLVGWIVRNRRPLLINNFDQARSKLGYYTGKEESQIKAFMGCPVGHGGALCLDSKRTYSFSDKDQKILGMFADLVEVGRKREERFAFAEAEAANYRSLERIYSLRDQVMRWQSFLDQYLDLVSQTTGFPYVFFAACDDKGRGGPGGLGYHLEGWNQKIMSDQLHGARFDQGSGLVGWVFKNGQSVTARETGAKTVSPLFGKKGQTPAFRAVVCQPVIVDRAVRGVLGLASEQAQDGGEAGAVTFSRLAAEHLALFLENLYLRSRLHGAAQKASNPDT